MIMKKPRSIVLTSGGLDSSVLLAKVVKEYGANNVIALSIYYGQKHSKELEFAKEQAKFHGVQFISEDLSQVFKFDANCTLLKTNLQEIPCGPYSQQIANEGMPNTYVPFRNGLFLAYAASMALQVQAENIYYGAHKDDVRSVYPDCSRDFIEAMDAAIHYGTAGKVNLIAPFWNWKKSDIVAEGIRLEVPFRITWSCYNGGEYPCGMCGTCIDREKAFEANGIKDPLLVR